VVSTTVLLLPEFLPDLVEDDAVVFSFNDLSASRSYTTSADVTLVSMTAMRGPISPDRSLSG